MITQEYSIFKKEPRLPQFMPNDLTLDKVANKLISDASKIVIWPEDEPEVRQSWVDAIGADPNLLERIGKEFVGALDSYLISIETIGHNMSWIEHDDPSTVEAVVRSFSHVSSSDKDIRKKLWQVRSVLNLTERDGIDMRALRDIARHYLLYLEIIHDTNNYVGSASYIPQLSEKKINQFHAMGIHLTQISMALLNVMNHGPVGDYSFGMDFAYNLNNFFRIIRPDEMEIAYEAEHDVEFQGDRFNIYRAFFNLANNAMKRGKASRLRIIGTHDESSVTFQCMDNGCGLANEEGIFEYGSSYSGGTGLGLFLTRQITEAHGGTITAKAHWDDPVYNGACFTVTLPLKQEGHAIFYPTNF